MNRTLSKLSLYLLAIALLAMTTPLAAPALAATPAPAAGPAGDWLGALDVGSVKLRLALHIEKKSDGALEAVLDSIDQGAKIPIGAVAFESGKLTLSIPAIAASYEGTMSAAGDTLVGNWSQGGRALPLTFERQTAAFVLKRPQLPQGPFPYETREAAFTSEAGSVRLAGTFLVPAGKGPFPAVVMVTGSGPQDRDESLMGHKPFLVIADALARRGIASLRYDDRGAGASGGDHMGSTVDDFAADARAAVAYLRSQPEVAGKAIGIVGHSEGGLTGPKVAVADPSLAFLVLLAPPGEPLAALLMRQTRAAYRLQGLDEKLIDRALADQAEDLAIIADPAIPTDRLQERLRALAEAHGKRFTDEERSLLKLDNAAIEQSIQVATTPWFRSLMRQDPAVYLRKVKIPVLALFGEKDFQVEPQVNADAVRTALAAAKNPDYDVRILPDLNHLFQHAKTGAFEEYGTIEETFSPEALRRIGDWIEARFPPKRGA